MGILDLNDVISTGKKVFADTMNSFSGGINVPEEEVAPMRREIVDASAEVSAVKQNKIDNINNRAHQDEDMQALRVDNGPGGSKDPTVFTTIDDGIREDDSLRFNKVKQLTHDLAKESSAEQGVIDFFGRTSSAFGDSTLITPSEAASLGKEFGVDIKYDKNVSRGEAMFTINKNLYKKDLEEQLAFQAEGGGFTGMQNIGIAASAISGGMGAAELAATIGISFLLPEVGLAAIARLGRAGMVSKNAIEGINLAYRTQKAARVAQRYENAAKILMDSGAEIGAAEHAAALSLFAGGKGEAGMARAAGILEKNKQIIDSADKTTKFWYEMTSQAKFGQILANQEVGFAPKASLFAADFAASNVPSMVVAGYNSEKNQNRTYTLKDAAVETMFAGALGVALPCITKALGYGVKGGVNIIDGMVGKLKDVRAQAAADKALKGATDASSAVDKEASRTISQMESVAKSIKEPPRAILDNAAFLAKQNMTDEEFMMNIQHVIQSMMEGKVPRLESLPNKNMILSHVDPEIIDRIKNVTGDNIDDLLEHTHVGPDATDRFTTAVLKGETGLLGRNVVAPNQKQAMSMLTDIYKANMFQDTDAYIRAIEANDGLRQASSSLKNLNYELRTVLRKNIEGEGIGLSDQLDVYETVRDIVGKLYHGREYLDALEQLKAQEVEESLTGTKKALDKNHVDILQDVKDRIKPLVEEKKLNNGDSVYNLNEQKAQEFAEQIDGFANSNEDLIDTDEFLLQQHGTPEQMLEDLVNYKALTDTNEEALFGMPRVKTEDLIAKQNDIEFQLKRSNDAKYLLQAAMENNNYKAFANSLATIKAVAKNGRKETYNGFFDRLSTLSDNVDDLRANAFSEFKQSIVNKMNTDEDIAHVLKRFYTPDSYKPGIKSHILSTSSPLRKILTDVVVAPLEEKGFLVSGRDVDKVLNSFMAKMESDTEINDLFSKGSDAERGLKQALNPSNPSEAAAEEVGIQAQKVRVISELVDPMLATIEKELLNQQSVAVYTMARMVEDFSKMSRYPMHASEVILSNFTMTPFNIEGSALSIENITNNDNMYIKDIRRQLNAMSTGTQETDKMLKGGVNLNDHLDNPEKRKDILRAYLILRDHGTPQAAKDAGIHLNDDDAIVAKVILDQQSTMLNKLNDVGSLATTPGTNLHPGKLAKAEYLIPESEISSVKSTAEDLFKDSENYRLRYKLEEGAAESLQDEGPVDNAFGKKSISIVQKHKIEAEYMEGISKHMHRLINDLDVTKQRLAMYAFKNFDLDKMFNARGAYGYSLNKLRDEILEGRLPEAMDEDLFEFRRAFDPKTGGGSIVHIVDYIVGKKADPKTGQGSILGWIKSREVGSSNILMTELGQRSRFVDDLHDRVTFKDTDTELSALDLLGYDSIQEQLEHNFNTMQKAYAVLKTVGSEPMDYTRQLVDAWNQHVNLEARGKFAKEGDVRRASITKGAMKSLENNVKLACGLASSPASTAARVWRIAGDMLAAPLLVRAGIKSMTDYSYQHQWLITNGLADSKAVFEFGKTMNSMSKMLADKELRRVIDYGNAMNQDSIFRLLLNNETINLKKLADEAPLLEKAEQVSKVFSNAMINNIGMVDKATRLNKASGTLTLMRSIAAFADKSYSQLDERLQSCLTRHGIDEDDWRLLAKHGVEDVDDLVKRNVDTTKTGIERGFTIFSPTSILEMSDDAVRKEMTSRGYKYINDNNISRFREDLMEKAAILINTGANEMTTIPNVRTMSALSFGNDRNSGLGTALNILTKYQSFALAATQIHFGRRVAQHIDPSDMAGTRVLENLMGFGPGKALGAATLWRDVAGLTMATAFANYIVDEATDFVTGERQSSFKQDGSFNARKVTDPIASASGAFKPLLDLVFGVFGMGASKGNGVSLQVAPAASVVQRDVKNVFKAATSPSTRGNRTGAVTAALVQNAARNVGLSRGPFTALAWNHFFGAWIDQEAKGGAAYAQYIRGRKREGYIIPEWQSNPSLMGQQ